ncbi:MAG: CvpA family protein [Gammaproteobacteria bacterium]|nr:CvpA family protein [Gammaproteobacteria bacterium]NNF50165.1 CvpA family protein [Woeseiaceae bacterium]MBT8093938.1 CvpA family protein [Gammaproteobacteria bacterium]MBT8106168.1 CvpA family protein [Gammaproteobacteria bacterium]NNK26182.1 CvpA family protein [Woeseiaceae bacterium]
MPIIDIIIAVAILISVVVGIFRGFVREAISVAALLFAIWSALYFGPALGSVTDTWLNSEELQKWFGRVLVFAVVLLLGALLGWALSKIVRWSALSGMDRFLGALFGTGRGVLLVAVGVIGGEFAGFDNDEWWAESRLIPHFEVVAEWIKVMAPEGLDVILPDQEAEALPVPV